MTLQATKTGPDTQAAKILENRVPDRIGKYVIINEVAWAGTQAFAGDEWIELYNAGSAPVDLTNWRIQAADGDPLILLSGNLAPGGYLLLERGSQNVTNVPGVVYNSVSLSDTGETLYLLDDTSSILDTANSNGGGWPSGAGVHSSDARTTRRRPRDCSPQAPGDREHGGSGRT